MYPCIYLSGPAGVGSHGGGVRVGQELGQLVGGARVGRVPGHLEELLLLPLPLLQLIL